MISISHAWFSARFDVRLWLPGPMPWASSKASDHVEKKLREVGFTGRFSGLDNYLELQRKTMTLEAKMEIH